MAKKNLFSKLFAKSQQGSALEVPKPELPILKLLFFIVDWNQAHIITDVFVEGKVRFHFIAKGMGTANSEILDLLGIGAGDKAVVICLEQAVGISVLMQEVRKKLSRNGPGAGISFTVPLSAINDPVLLVFKQSIQKNEKVAAEIKLKKTNNVHSGGKGVNMSDELLISKGAQAEVQKKNYDHDLIMCIVNQGYSDELMNTARGAGASGGTVINARGQAHEGAVKFFGISVQDEKQIILILTSREKKVPIMQAICEAHGLNTKAQGIAFSLPVDNLMGLSLD